LLDEINIAVKMKKLRFVIVLIAGIFLLVWIPDLSLASNRKKDKKKHENKSAASQETIDNQGAGPDFVYMTVEEMPEFPGGVNELVSFVARNLRYPGEAQRKGIQGKVFVGFVVEKDGSVGNVRVVNGVDFDLDAEAVRVVKLLPNWRPGKIKGEAVRVAYTIPINFKFR